MRILKFIIAFLLTISLTYILNNPIKTSSRAIPPIGKLLNPFSGFWKNAESTQTPSDQNFEFEELSSKVEVVYDKQLVPHIYADNLTDAYFVQGFITAKHRLWQMDVATRATSGRLAEIMGPSLIKRDQLQRRRGMVFAAENILEGWKKFPEDLKNLDSYTAGVNAYINSIQPGEYPIEFKLLDYAPEEWTNLKSAIFTRSMAQSLCMRETDLEATNALAVFGKEVFNFLYPDQNPKQSPIIPEGTVWDFEPIPIPEEGDSQLGYFEHEPMPKAPPFIGSNNWAVAGSKTKSGKPILCNDPHLQLTLPAIWFEIQITTPEGSTYGVSLPGSPGVIIGFNKHISFGMTNVGHDVLDYYKITWADESCENYIIDGQSKPVKYRYETINVKDSEPIIDTVRYTEWGPILYDDNKNQMKDLAMRWLAHDGGSGELSMVRKFHTAKNFDDYYETLSGWDAPPQNVVFGSTDGDIALKVQGKFPLKRKSQGRFIRDGSKSSEGWLGFIPKSHNPQTLNPERGFVASANQHSTDPSYPYYYNGGFDDYRGRTLNMFLDSLSEITIEDMKKLQNNTFSMRAADALPSMLSHLDWQAKNDQESKLFEELKNWDYYFEKELLAPVLFDYWFDEFYAATWDEINHKEDSLGIEILRPEYFRTISLLENNPDHYFFDILKTKETETAKEVLNQTFKTAMNILMGDLKNNPDFNLKEYKQVQVPHLGRIAAFGSPVLDVGGDGNALNAIKKTHGPSWRMIVDLSTPIKAYGVYPGGQSGNPGSPFYDNMLSTWVQGEYYEKNIWYSSDQGGDKVLFKQTFE